MTTQILKIQIVNPTNVSWKVLGEVLRDLQYATWKTANFGIQTLWDYSNFDFAYKERYGDYFKKVNGTLPSGKKSITTDIKIRTDEFNHFMNGSMKDATFKMIEEKWKIDLPDVLNGNKSIANFKRTIPLELHNRQMKNKDGITLDCFEDGKYKNYSIDIALLAKEYAKEKYDMKDGWFNLVLAAKDKYQTAILDRLISGEYKLSMSKLNQKDKKWFLLLAYTFENEKKELDRDKILGIDLGVNVPAVTALNFNSRYRRDIGDGEEINSFKTQMYKRMDKLKQSRSFSGNGSSGRGRKTKMKPLERLSGKIENFKNTKNHAISKEIINEALKYKCATIQMEDLSGIKANATFLKNWSYFDLQQKIEYKAKLNGIKVVKISPRYTSSRCNKCGFVHSKEMKVKFRPTQDKFICQNCGHTDNADSNAAKNIAMKGIENIIETQVKLEIKNGIKF